MLRLQENIDLAPLTTFHIGGMARYFLTTKDPSVLSEAFEYAEMKNIPIYVLGGGSNILFSDKGFLGLIVQWLDDAISVSENRMLCGAGSSLTNVVQTALEHNLTGIERLAGIPGSFGGAIRGNAGAFGTEIGQYIMSVRVLNCHTGMMREYTRQECHFGYRTSFFKQHPDSIILSAELRLASGEKVVSAKMIHDTIALRESKHPQDAFCAGSFFINPYITNKRLLREFAKDTGSPSKDGKLPAGWLIDTVGLRGHSIGGAMISTHHPNYIVNTGVATAEDVIMLASLIKMRVRDELNVRLQEEIQYVGF
ncbi:MAG: UDP-N-acetylmuramate dehydrogenase [Minisyncoccota bacterium]